jgi:hypothetical protein
VDWWVWVLVIVVLGVVATLWWRSSGRTPDHVERGEHRPGSQDQFRGPYGGGPG